MTVRADKLLRMAEQIAANISISEDADVVAERTADHLNRFWDVRMRARFVAEYTNNNNALSDILKVAITHIRTQPGARSG